MRELRSLLILLVLAMLVGVGVAEAQQGSANIRGRAVDEQGATLPAVTVVVTHQETGIFRETLTAGDGMYSVPNLVPGAYRISAELAGFKKLALENVVLTAGVTQTQDLLLEIGALEESVTVSGQGPQVDVTSVKVGANVSLREVQAMPTAVNNVIGLIQVVPGVAYLPGGKQSTEAVSVNGQNGTHIWYIDGGNVTLGTFACCAARVFTPTDVIQEVEVITSQVPAEYGGRTGAVINTITRQGSNAFHGGFHGFYSNQNFISPNYFLKRDNLKKADAELWQAGVTLGGPILRKKIFFFGSFERDSRGRNLAFVFPSTPEKNFTTNAVTDSANSFIRVDHQINANNIYAFRYMESRRKCGDPTGCRAANTILIATAPFTSNATGYDQNWIRSLWVVTIE